MFRLLLVYGESEKIFPIKLSNYLKWKFEEKKTIIDRMILIIWGLIIIIKYLSIFMAIIKKEKAN